MIGMKIGWLVLELSLLTFFLYFGDSLAFFAFLLLVIIPLCSLLVNLYVRKHLKVFLKANVNLRKGEAGKCTLLLDNSTVFPVLRVRCVLQAENQLNREIQAVDVATWLPPKKQSEAYLDVGCDYCGRIRLVVSKIILYDCFGLIGISCRCTALQHITVQPDTFEMNVSLIPGLQSSDDSDVYSQNKPGYDLSETFQIREYVPGDSPKQIHWKLSNKFDKLIVRDPGLPITRNVLIFWERSGESGDKELIDAQAEVLISLCRALLDQSIQFTVGWNDTDRNLCILHEIQDMDQLVGIIPRLMRASGKKEAESGAALLIQTRESALCAHMLYLAEEAQSEMMDMKRYGHVTALLCGKTGADGAVLFDAKQYRDQLAQIEL